MNKQLAFVLSGGGARGALQVGALRALIVSSDLNTGTPVLHGRAPDEKILEALLVSTALPPWSMPTRKRDRYLMDGGMLSNLPVEPALKAGATEIIALDLTDTRETFTEQNGICLFLDRLTFAVEKRQMDLELELARERRIPITYIDLVSRDLVPLWDFCHTNDLIVQGYDLALSAIEQHSGELHHTMQVAV
jgi:NTE family protein